MSFAKVYSAQPTLLSAQIIFVETDLSRGLHSFAIVGLPDKAVEESRDRVSAAIKNTGFTSPKSKNQKVIISLAPANIKKEGPSFDVAIALSYLSAAGEISFDAEKKLFLGELSLDGDLRPVHGVLPAVKEAASRGFTEVFVPLDNAREAALIDNISVFGAKTLADIISHINEKTEEKTLLTPHKKTKISHKQQPDCIEFDDIRGQETAKRGLEIAAAGGHNIVLYGPPGTGKTMLAKALTNLLPPLSSNDMLEVTAIYSVAGTLSDALITTSPFRSPHHTASYVSVVGGGTLPKPGEVTLAHRGVLFLDEFPLFERRVIEALRQPLEDHIINISRARGSALFPANFILIAAMNPCPCGNFGSSRECICPAATLERYQRKISGPIIDRIDMWIEVAHIAHEKLSRKPSGTQESKRARVRIAQARAWQEKRFKNRKRRITTNSEMTIKDLDALIHLLPDVQALLNESATRLDLSPRSYHRTIKLARTIADLDKQKEIGSPHFLEALQYRPRKWLAT